MAVTLNGTIVLNPITSRELTTERDDVGFSTPTLSLTGYSDRARANLAAAKEIVRQLNEMASNYWYRIVHLADSDDAQYDGLYELLSATVTGTPSEANIYAALFAVTVTLRRIGGGGTSGANLTRRVSTVAALNANSYGITAQSVIPTPVNAYPLLTTASTHIQYQTENGGIRGHYTTTYPVVVYAMSGADVSAGECKVWDIGPAPDVRVWSTDHAFASAEDVLLDNGMVRVGCHSTDGDHYYQVWDGSAWQTVTVSDLTNVGGTHTHTFRSLTIDELSPWRVSATWTYSIDVTPYLWSKTITVERGKHLAKVVVTPVAAATIKLRPMDVRFLLTRRTTDNLCARDTTVDGLGALSIATDNVLMGFNTITDDILCVAAISSTSVTAGTETGPFAYIQAVTASSLTVWLGGVPYDCVDAVHEAESGSLLGGATTTSTLSGDSGNSVVQMDALNERASMTAQTTLPSGSHAIAWFRIASSVASGAGNAGDTLLVGIWNNTTAASAASTTVAATSATYFAAANTLNWISVEYTSWNGTDALYPYFQKTASATAQAFYCDEVIFLTYKSGNADKADDAATLAMTDNHYWGSIDRRVW